MKETELDEVLLSAFKYIKVGVHIYHLEKPGDDRSLRMVYANEYSEALIGQKVKDMVGKTIDECFPTIREKDVPQKYLKVVTEGQDLELEDISYKDEQINGAFSIKAYRLPYDCVGVMFDNITSRIVAENDLKQKNNDYAAINAVMLGRETKMIELKNRIKELESKLK